MEGQSIRALPFFISAPLESFQSVKPQGIWGTESPGSGRPKGVKAFASKAARRKGSIRFKDMIEGEVLRRFFRNPRGQELCDLRSQSIQRNDFSQPDRDPVPARF